MKLRRITSLTAFVSFVLLLLTSVVLYIVPEGRIAYWNDWTLGGLTKEDWTDIHVNIGWLFVLFVFIHLALNWKPLINYLRNKTRSLRFFTPEMIVTLLIVILTILGTWYQFPPFSWVQEYSEANKDELAIQYGEPPYGHAELDSLHVFLRKVDIEPKEALAHLKEAGIVVEDPKAPLTVIAKDNGIPPSKIYIEVKDLRRTGGMAALMPEAAPVGTGKKALYTIAEQYGLDPDVVVMTLNGMGIPASIEASLKDIAEESNTTASDIWDRLRVMQLEKMLNELTE